MTQQENKTLRIKANDCLCKAQSILNKGEHCRTVAMLIGEAKAYIEILEEIQ